MIQVKTANVLAALLKWQYHHKLILLILWTLKRHKRIMVTEGFRPARHADDLHATKPVRAIDCRSWIYKNPRTIKKDVDDNWLYDPDRPELSCCKYHNVGLGWHFHFQVHPKTIFRDGLEKIR